MIQINESGRVKFKEISKLQFFQLEKIRNRFKFLGYDFAELCDLKDYLGQDFWLPEDQSRAIIQALQNSEYGKVTKEQVRKDNDRAIKYYGTTHKWDCAGYLLTTGELLSFSEDNKMRDLDHRDIIHVLDDRIPDSSSPVTRMREAMNLFINYGNIRVMEKGMDLACPPTEEQKKVIRRYIWKTKEFYFYISNERGGIMKETYVEDCKEPEMILNEIDEFFSLLA